MWASLTIDRILNKMLIEDLDKKIEAVLFYKNEPMEIKELSSILGVKEEEIRSGILRLKQRLKDGGLALIETGSEVSLSTNRGNSDLIERIAKDELSSDIGKAGLETLSIILYKDEISRREIDYIRGVNSSFILRNLALRGLIERSPSKEDKRLLLYRPTIALFAHLGIRNKEELPEYVILKGKLAEIEEI